MRLVYFGSGAFGLPTLQALARTHSIVGVITQPDKPAGRGGKLTPTPIGAWAAEHLPTIPLLKPAKVNDPAIIDQIRGLNSDAWVVIAFGQKLSRALLEARFAINLHASLLPRWRGAAPINAAILGGDHATGNTIITLADRMDAGQILAASSPPRPIDPLMTAGELHDVLAADGPALVEKVLADFTNDSLNPARQDESLVTIATKLSKSDDNMDFNQRADFVRRQIHALTPWPGITCAIIPPITPTESSPTTKPIQIKVLRVQPITGINHQDPGTLLDVQQGIVACAHETQLKLLEVQPAGRTPMKWDDFMRGAGRAIVPNSRLIPARESL